MHTEMINSLMTVCAGAKITMKLYSKNIVNETTFLLYFIFHIFLHNTTFMEQKLFPQMGQENSLMQFDFTLQIAFC